MEVVRLSSVGAPILACPSSSYTHHFACSRTLSTTSALLASPSFLPIKLESSPSKPNDRSAIWGATPIRYVSQFGTVSLLLLAPRLFERSEETVVRRSGVARAYKEPTNPLMKFLNRVQGALPVVGLISRLASPEGGIGTDRIRFDEFCTRVARNCTRQDSRAFYEFAERHGKFGRTSFVLIWCWAAALGAGLLRSDDLLLGAARLRVSFDIQYEVENFDLLMDEGIQKREKSGSKIPDVPMEIRAEKALEAICKCCIGSTVITEEDAPLLSAILKAVFPTADKGQIEDAVAARLFDPLVVGSANPDDSEGSDEFVASNVSLGSTKSDEGQDSKEIEAADDQMQSVVQELSQ